MRRNLVMKAMAVAVAAAMIIESPVSTFAADMSENDVYADVAGEEVLAEESSDDVELVEEKTKPAGYDSLNFCAFDNMKNIKQNKFVNWNVRPQEGSEKWEYEGKTYNFSGGGLPGSGKDSDTPVSCQLMLREPNEYAEPAGRGRSTHYYAFNMSDPDIKKRIEAYFDYLAYHNCTNDHHVDNWILGNEVNMPEQWYWSGTNDPGAIVENYAQTYMLLWKAVRRYTDKARVSVCLDHSWNDNDEGRGVAAREFLDRFDARCKELNGGQPVDWCVTYHPYPAVLFESEIWLPTNKLTGTCINPKSEGARFVDGANLNIMTDYIKNTYGANHRVMCTEWGATQYRGEDAQAACLAYTYMAMKYNDMVDACIMQYGPGGFDGGQMNFAIAPKGVTTWTCLDSDDPADEQWLKNNILPIIGVSSWEEIIPGYTDKPIDKEKVGQFVDRLYRLCLKREAEADGRNNWINKLATKQDNGANVAYGFFFSAEAKKQNISDEEFVERLYQVMLGREADAGGKADWLKKLKEGVGREGVFTGFIYSSEYNSICASYGIERGDFVSSEPRSKNPALTQFVNRMYTKALNRDGEIDGLNYWCDEIQNGRYTPDDMATAGFFESTEFKNRKLNDEDFVETAYQTFFDRPSDAPGKADWLNRMHSQGYSRMEVLQGFCGSQEFANLKASFGL